MICNEISPGERVPEEINVIIEIPAHSAPVKYEVDKCSGMMVVNRFMATAMRYPCNYGYIPQTLFADGDPADVLVITPFPLLSGSAISCRPIGILRMSDEAGEDSKVLAVPTDELTDLYRDIETFNDLPASQLHSISHFFEHYKDLEPKKWVKVDGWYGVDIAKQEIMAAIAKFQQAN